jgi:hypothetical protein
VPRARRNNSRKGTQASSLDGVLRFTNRPHSEEIASQAPPLSLFVSAGKRTYTRSYLYPEIAKTLTKLFGLGAAGGVPPSRLRTFWLRLRSRLLRLPSSQPSSLLRLLSSLPLPSLLVSLLKGTLGPPQRLIALPTSDDGSVAPAASRYSPNSPCLVAREQFVCRTPLIMVPHILDGRCPVSVSRLRQTR